MEGLASDDAAVAVVRLLVDGVPVGETAQSAFRFTWDSRTVANGAHVLTVEATDTSGRVGAAQLGVSVQN